MPVSGLRGPFPLNAINISAAVSMNGQPGAYALGRNAEPNNTFYVSYVGRSDADIATRLQNWVGSYPAFKFEYYPSAKAAFDKECALYHDFNPPDNTIHPAKPANQNWKCLRCGQ